MEAQRGQGSCQASHTKDVSGGVTIWTLAITIHTLNSSSPGPYTVSYINSILKHHVWRNGTSWGNKLHYGNSLCPFEVCGGVSTKVLFFRTWTLNSLRNNRAGTWGQNVTFITDITKSSDLAVDPLVQWDTEPHEGKPRFRVRLTLTLLPGLALWSSELSAPDKHLTPKRRKPITLNLLLSNLSL